MEEINTQINNNQKELVNLIINIIDKGGNYVIKSMPINKHIKEILMDIKESINTKDFGQIIKIALSSSIREGLEIVGASKETLSQLDNLVSVSLDGGLVNGINVGIDTVNNQKESKNVFYKDINDFFTKLKSFVSSVEFKNKLYASIDKSLNKVDDFKELCNDWYDAYDKFDLKDIQNIANRLNKLKTKVKFNTNCITENNIIQNVTELVKYKKNKLTKNQFEICNDLYEI